jgi:alpha-D-ribose 1-methylphosphonate 5-triphosphate synthase subunit PhnH
MSAIAAELLTPGFDDPVHDAQRVFRGLLDALSHPGRCIDLAPAFSGLAGLPSDIPRSLAASLLALTDADAPVWITPDAPALAALLRFHAGAPVLAAPAGAAFAAVLNAARVLPLARYERGTPDYPDRSTTVFIAVPALEGGSRVRLRGPGLATSTTIAPRGLPTGFWHERAAGQIDFPLGIEIYLCAGSRVLGLPRTTHAEEEG